MDSSWRATFRADNPSKYIDKAVTMACLLTLMLGRFSLSMNLFPHSLHLIIFLPLMEPAGFTHSERQYLQGMIRRISLWICHYLSLYPYGHLSLPVSLPFF